MTVLSPENQSFCFVLSTRQDDLIFIRASLFFNYELRITNYELPITLLLSEVEVLPITLL
ncbi:hypothetical protein NO976_00999 [Planktothrix agardhii]|jgi:hypothetical protein|nr:hypothetical protein NIVACYA_01236 [Planktothrix agardhii]CAD5925867.1 hypothetical protein NO976_00999 [Planktothrix agardhii]CAD5930316.1 hypothetical protein PCC7805_01254 [Planktothrix agardhii]CAD5936264.1 hypothetical protein NO365_01621 [Planktothrix agardhii]CAD5945632.1 hypothetical protein PCC7811_02215 [Planktothrix agardhii]